MHAKVKEAYNQAGFQIPSTPQDVREEQFKKKTKRARDEEVKKFINQVYRISQGKKDFIFYEQKEVGPDLAGNEDTLTTQVGKYDLPKFRKIYDPTTGDVQAAQLSGTETIYEIPYSAGKMKEILDSGDTTNTVFTLIVGNRKYGGFTADDFVEKSFDELAEMAINGNVGGVRASIQQFREQQEEHYGNVEERLKQFREEQKRAEEEARRIREERLNQGGGQEDKTGLSERETPEEQRPRDGPDSTTKVKEEVKSILRKPQEAVEDLGRKLKGEEDEDDKNQEEEPTFRAAGEEGAEEEGRNPKERPRNQGKKGR